jgi:hypothetical protein
MRAFHRIFKPALAAFLIVSGPSCGKSTPKASFRPSASAQFRADSIAITTLVRRFGQRLKRISLLAPEPLLRKSLRQEYWSLVTPDLLESWLRDPSRAPGRTTSSPWPETIEVRSMARVSSDEYRVDGEVLERTSADLASGTASARIPVHLTVLARRDRWMIARYEAFPLGSAEEAQSLGEDSLASPSAAADVIRFYYAAINARRYHEAYERWEQDGQASGQTFEQFQEGFQQTARVEPEIGPPGPLGAAAGSRYVDVPVRLTAWARDGSSELYSGVYTLRRSVVDGATTQQRLWHIYSARIRRRSRQRRRSLFPRHPKDRDAPGWEGVDEGDELGEERGEECPMPPEEYGHRDRGEAVEQVVERRKDAREHDGKDDDLQQVDRGRDEPPDSSPYAPVEPAHRLDARAYAAGCHAR